MDKEVYLEDTYLCETKILSVELDVSDDSVTLVDNEGDGYEVNDYRISNDVLAKIADELISGKFVIEEI